MKQWLCTIALAFGVVFVVAAPAGAKGHWWDFFDYAEALSGPGPFWGFHVSARVACVGNSPELVETRRALGTTKEQLRSTSGAVVDDAKRLVPNPSLGGDEARLISTAQDLKDRIAEDLEPETWLDLLTQIDELTVRLGRQCEQDGGRNVICSALPSLRISLATMRAQILTREKLVVRLAWLERPALAVPSVGVRVSACSNAKNRDQWASFDLDTRFLYSDETNDPTDWAGGNSIRLTTIVPGVMFRPLRNYPKADFVDVGAGVGMFVFASSKVKPGSFSTFTGVVAEPWRVDVHAPAAWAQKGSWIRGVTLRWAPMYFPRDFAANRFGPNLSPAKAQPIKSELLLHNFTIIMSF